MRRNVPSVTRYRSSARNAKFSCGDRSTSDRYCGSRPEGRVLGCDRCDGRVSPLGRELRVVVSESLKSEARMSLVGRGEGLVCGRPVAGSVVGWPSSRPSCSVSRSPPPPPRRLYLHIGSYTMMELQSYSCNSCTRFVQQQQVNTGGRPQPFTQRSVHQHRPAHLSASPSSSSTSRV
jgi:hypothetical protein